MLLTIIYWLRYSKLHFLNLFDRVEAFRALCLAQYAFSARLWKHLSRSWALFLIGISAPPRSTPLATRMGCDISDSFIHQQRAYLRTFEPSQHPHPSSKSSESCSTHHFYLCDPEFRQFSICPAERESLLAERLVRRMLRGKPRSLTAQRRVCRLVYLVFLSNMHSNSYFSCLLVSLATAFRDEPKLREISLEERVFTSNIEDLLWLSKSFSIGSRNVKP